MPNSTINATTNGLNSTAGNVATLDLQVAGSTVASATSGGVAITGTLSASGATTLSGAVSASSLSVNSNNISADNSLGFRNRIINGDMRIDQRYAGTATANTINGYAVDRWSVNQSTSGKIIAQQNAGSVTPPTGFANYLGITSQSAYSVGSGDYYLIGQAIEGYNIADLAWGTANAKTVIVSFWVRSSLTGTFGGSFGNNGTARSYLFTYTISAANTWEYKTVTVAGDTSGTWEKTTSTGLNVRFSFGVGTTYSGTADTWATATKFSPTGATSVVGTNGATFYITGVQLEVGSTATPFERRPYGTELMLCQRYYYRLGPSISSAIFSVGWNISTTQAFSLITYPVTMRTAPSALEQSGTAGDYAIYHGGGTGGACSSVPTFSVATTQNCRILATVSSGLTSNGGSMLRAETASGYLGFSAEI